MPFLNVRNVGKRFGGFRALEDVSLDIRAGELLTFLGPSGCGKSTLLRIITGLERPSSGSILHLGRDITALSAARRGFGILFQSYALFPNLTVADNVAYGLTDRRTAKARVAELLDLVGLPNAAAKYPGELSGGQQQRVALARALAPAPKLLLLDEPLSALDAKVRVHLRQQIRDLQRRLGLTTVMVTHDQEEALAMADRIVVMNHGTIEQIGTPSEVYGRPASLFVADFVGRMNFLPGRVSAADVFTPQAAAGILVLPAGGAAGGPATVCIRPEDVTLAPLAAGQGPNTSRARLAAVEFLGAFCRVQVVAPEWGDLGITADVPAGPASGLDLTPGAPLDVTLRPERLHIFAGAVDA
ncbi:putative 2-aminoethylphosphonate ABC transporter ATP-binding protein [Methylobacterium sp. ID0610]|uniref:putative 2-aminoethylphosphonate ABC transporter ATP-binding protein n=1 Tax=Methylobacterium carpenticola TaxID=3344827 RepID=UPI003693A715